MKYFILTRDPRYTDSPELLSLPEGFDVRDIRMEGSRRLPSRAIATIYPNEYTVFPDVLTSMFLLVSSMCMDVIKMYEPQMISKQLILMDRQYNHMETYHLPILPRIQCLTKDSLYNRDKSVLEHGILDLDKVGKLGIFRLADVKNTYTIIRQDLLESMLKRGAKGLMMTPLETIETI